MAKFDPRKWEDRAWTRYAKVAKDKRVSPKRKKSEARKLNKDIAAINGLKAVVEWCELRRISVEFTNRHSAGSYHNDNKIIYINSTQTLEKQLFVLLHECGHLLIDDPSDTTLFRFRHGYHETKPEIKRKFIHRCQILEEEFEAWYRGRKLANKLGIQINDYNFETLKAGMLKSYMKWALKDPNYQADGPE